MVFMVQMSPSQRMLSLNYVQTEHFSYSLGSRLDLSPDSSPETLSATGTSFPPGKCIIAKDKCNPETVLIKKSAQDEKENDQIKEIEPEIEGEEDCFQLEMDEEARNGHDEEQSSAIHNVSPADTRLSLVEDPVKSEDKRSVSDQPISFSITDSNGQHAIANSKLEALLSLLEKDRTYVRNVEKTKKPSYSNGASSPTDFGRLFVKDSSASSRSSSLERCDSTPELSFSDKVFMKSPQIVKPLDDESSDDDDAEDEKPIRRTSSLKSGKTPPGTPGRRKIVRFADVFGLELADVKTFLDEVPRVPKSAYKDLKDVDLSDFAGNNNSSSLSSSTSSLSTFSASSAASPTKLLVPMFNQPGNSPNFFDRLRDKKVCLENSFMSGGPGCLQGTIRVQNIAFEKRVVVRYTTNEWMTSTDIAANHVQGSCDGFSDKFSFRLILQDLSVGQRVQFCILYTIGNSQEFWDSNDGNNFTFQCVGSGHFNNGGASLTVPMTMSRGKMSNISMSHSPSCLSEDPWSRYS